jgi:hypothetical protein
LLLALKSLAFFAVFSAVFFAAGGKAELTLLGGAVPLPARFRKRGNTVAAAAKEMNR